MNASRFQAEGPKVRVEAKRRFGKCAKCNARFVSPATVEKQTGRNVTSFLGPRGWDSQADTHSYTRTVPGTLRMKNPDCPKCRSHNVKWEGVKGQLVPEVPCDARCTTAKGPNCNCSCGGEHHGEGVAA